jgi:hypothetical protein
MGRVFNLVLLAAMIVAAAVTYDMKHKAEQAASEVAALQSDVAREKERITLLKAEWSMLTQPARLQATVERYADHFQLQPFSPEQIASIDEIPLRPVGIDAEAAKTLDRIAAAAPAAIQ